MAEEAVQNGTVSDGNGIVLWVPAIANPLAPTPAELNAAGVKKLTYGITGDGFQHGTTFAVVTKSRYTLAQALEDEGVATDTLEITYVYNRTTPTVAELALGVKGATGFIVHVLGYENGHVFVATDKINAILPVKLGTSRDVPPTANGELAKIVKANVTGIVRREVAVAA
ncbi:phage tail tube protein [Microbacterium gilvum]|uniref:Phage tail protein n=1 Tax=Microbacterium gilvum TaxID=1336204 RepID=A0ABP8ZQ13_9MICO